MNRCLLALGSNVNKEWNIDQAIQLLRIFFDCIYFSEALLTEPIGQIHFPGDFLNQLAWVYTPLEEETVQRILKQIEQELGRQPEDKISGRIPIDIDLLQWNDCILKPADMERAYVQEGIQSLSVTMQHILKGDNKS
ncbi:2-amino-4-hydroxy-6-hydroxymethyldihydropteridine diphosphokinase [Parabacteroides sp. PM5-20]|uniref:2-amino-4-hydroxy-6- hydroxymethyldihydropteridine diphosphokinase n=1 Tax=unclassified Parabacteroides TaxID=2649774 RepID=UPI001EF2ABE7|nr:MULTISPECIES: 2-amino-4-hydroxy-6-hydroxymethyldihydropteridine diphosphokinase [unclassified Parabacteroides]MDH6533899.1 2-amino-4-hydroxy-6-hydroxymethyldihydropteridine diphosphokinase [Parabacteroides sp. PM5-20]